jgi:hypothetical protein
MLLNAQIEIRSFFEPADFGEAFTPELQEGEERLWRRIESNQGTERQ